jgi:hypothetical protein
MIEGSQRKIVFHRLFRMRLVQMIRHGETRKAIAFAGRELRIARKHYGEDGDESAGGIVMVPIPSRAKKFGYDDLSNPEGPKP